MGSAADRPARQPVAGERREPPDLAQVAGAAAAHAQVPAACGDAGGEGDVRMRAGRCSPARARAPGTRTPPLAPALRRCPQIPGVPPIEQMALKLPPTPRGRLPKRLRHMEKGTWEPANLGGNGRPSNPCPWGKLTKNVLILDLGLVTAVPFLILYTLHVCYRCSFTCVQY